MHCRCIFNSKSKAVMDPNQIHPADAPAESSADGADISNVPRDENHSVSVEPAVAVVEIVGNEPNEVIAELVESAAQDRIVNSPIIIVDNNIIVVDNNGSNDESDDDDDDMELFENDDENPEDDIEYLIEDDELERDEIPDLNELRRQLRSQRGPLHFDTELPSQHSYLGTLNPISGTMYLEPNCPYLMPLIGHSQIVFPGEEVPMIFNEQDALHLGLRSDTQIPDGTHFGLFFMLDGPQQSSKRYYGVTCQVYEMASSHDGIVRVKVLAKQRFEITRKLNPTIQLFSATVTPNNDYISLVHHLRRQLATIIILPELQLPDALFGYETSSMSKFRNSNALRTKLRNRMAASAPLPRFVYDMYDVQSVMKNVKNFLLAMDIEIVDMDPVAMSFWCAKNVLLHNSDRLEIFETNSVTKRMYIISKSLHYMRYFVCCQCKAKIAHFNSLFAMSKQSIQTNFCNPAGYIHETNTVLSTVPNAVYLQGLPCSQFSWFPGYAWQIAACRRCNGHIGWKFTVSPDATNLLPKKFYGLSGGRILIRCTVPSKSANEGESVPEHEDAEQLLDQNVVHDRDHEERLHALLQMAMRR